MHWVTFPATLALTYHKVKLTCNSQWQLLPWLTYEWSCMCVNSVDFFNSVYFYCIYTNIYSISYMMSSWSPHQLHHNLVQLPMHSMDVCTLIILIKFQNFYTRILPYTVAPHCSSWKSWQDTHRHHWEFTAWPLDQSWLDIKAAATGENLHLVFQFSNIWLHGLKIYTSSGL